MSNIKNIINYISKLDKTNRKVLITINDILYFGNVISIDKKENTLTIFGITLKNDSLLIGRNMLFKKVNLSDKIKISFPNDKLLNKIEENISKINFNLNFTDILYSIHCGYMSDRKIEKLYVYPSVNWSFRKPNNEFNSNYKTLINERNKYREIYNFFKRNIGKTLLGYMDYSFYFIKLNDINVTFDKLKLVGEFYKLIPRLSFKYNCNFSFDHYEDMELFPLNNEDEKYVTDYLSDLNHLRLETKDLILNDFK